MLVAAFRRGIAMYYVSVQTKDNFVRSLRVGGFRSEQSAVRAAVRQSERTDVAACFVKPYGAGVLGMARAGKFTHAVNP